MAQAPRIVDPPLFLGLLVGHKSPSSRFRFQVLGFGFQVSGFRFQVSGFRV